MAAWRAYARRDRALVLSALLVVAGLGGALAGGALVGEWCLGLVLIGESAGAVWFGLCRDDGRPLPRRGQGRTHADVIEDLRRVP